MVSIVVQTCIHADLSVSPGNKLPPLHVFVIKFREVTSLSVREELLHVACFLIHVTALTVKSELLHEASFLKPTSGDCI